MCPCCCCCCYSRTVCTGRRCPAKKNVIEERLVWRLHWTAFSSQRECVWQLTEFPVARKERPGLNRIVHPDLVKLSVELNLRVKPKYEISLHYNSLIFFKRFVWRSSTNSTDSGKHSTSQNSRNPHPNIIWVLRNPCPFPPLLNSFAASTNK